MCHARETHLPSSLEYRCAKQPVTSTPFADLPFSSPACRRAKSGHYQEVESINTCWRKSRTPHSTTFDKRIKSRKISCSMPETQEDNGLMIHAYSMCLLSCARPGLSSICPDCFLCKEVRLTAVIASIDSRFASSMKAQVLTITCCRPDDRRSAGTRQGTLFPFSALQTSTQTTMGESFKYSDSSLMQKVS